MKQKVNKIEIIAAILPLFGLRLEPFYTCYDSEDSYLYFIVFCSLISSVMVLIRMTTYAVKGFGKLVTINWNFWTKSSIFGENKTKDGFVSLLGKLHSQFIDTIHSGCTKHKDNVDDDDDDCRSLWFKDTLYPYGKNMLKTNVLC